MGTFLFVVFWLTCAGFTAYIASQKNRDATSWFLIGFLFGLFALIAIAAVPALPKPEGGTSSSSDIPSRWQCPECTATNGPDMMKCYNCGSSKPVP